MTAREQKPAAVENFQLQQNYPNPFNYTTDIRFSLPHSLAVNLEVFDITGRNVATLADEVFAAGSHRVTFNAADLPSGLYLCWLTAGTEVRVQKMVLLK